MAGVDAALERAQRSISVAEHLLTQTYPVVRDPRLLPAVLHHVYASVAASLEAGVLVALERKTLVRMPRSFEGRVRAFTREFSVEKPVLRFLRELQETVREHERSPVEFARRGSFVMCDESYRLRTLREETMKQYCRHARTIQRIIGEQR